MGVNGMQWETSVIHGKTLQNRHGAFHFWLTGPIAASGRSGLQAEARA
jgi:hypothetical protein